MQQGKRPLHFAEPHGKITNATVYDIARCKVETPLFKTLTADINANHSYA
jgi:hypothetical protein